MKPYKVIDITTDPPKIVQQFETEHECIVSIDDNGGDCPLCKYTYLLAD